MAASMTARAAVASILNPKLLVPNPTVDTTRPERPRCVVEVAVTPVRLSGPAVPETGLGPSGRERESSAFDVVEDPLHPVGHREGDGRRAHDVDAIGLD